MAKKRKTRKEKVRSGLRRAIPTRQIQQETNVPTTPTFTFVKREIDSVQAQSSSPASSNEKQEKPGQIETLASPTADLRKTFLIAGILFIFEAVLYWAWK